MGTLLDGTNLGSGGGGGGTDENVKVSANDTTAGKLNGKLVAGTNTSLTENNDGGNETLQVNTLTSFSDANKSLNLALSTGLLTGGEITINANPALFDVAAGTGYIVDSYTDPANPTFTEVSWSAMIGVTPTFLATAGTSFILVDSAGSLVQTATFPVNGNLRDKIQLGAIVHPDNVSITGKSDFTQTPLTQLAQTLTDLTIAIGVINTSGNTYFGTTGTLQIEKTSGTMVYGGIEYKADKKDPNRIITPAKAAATQFIYTWRDGIGGYNTKLTDIVEVGLYDDGTGGVSSPTGALNTNQWTISRVHYSPDANTTVVQFGQNIYNSSTSALDALANGSDVFESDPEFAGVPLRAFMITRGAATDLSLISDAVFRDSGKFGASLISGGTVTGAPTRQSVYEASAEPETITDSTRGADTWRRGSLADTDDVIEVQNGAGTKTFSITGNGDITTNAITTTSNINLGGNNIVSGGSGAFTGTLTSATLNTGQGDNELYTMNQDVQTTDNVTFNNISPTGTVDGRDVATDGTKLDGIETGAEVNNISDVNATDLTDGGDSTLHFHSADRARANHTGTQTLATISDAGTIASQDANNVAITGGSVTGITDLAIADGGTGASTAPAALTNLGGIGAATTDTLTNKTFDANGTGNSLSNVDVADLANGVDGELITWNAAGAPTTVAVGTANQVLTSNGAGAAPTFQDAAGGGGGANNSAINTNTSTAVANSSGTYQTACTVSITPSSTDALIACSVNANFQSTVSNTNVKVRVRRNGSVVVGEYITHLFFSTTMTNTIHPLPMFVIDAPATTGSTSYTFEFARSTGGTAILNANGSSISTLEVFEV